MVTRFSTGRKYIPARIKQARISRAYSQADLSNAIGVSKQAISQYETGVFTPGDEVIMSIADTLKFPISFFTKDIPVSNKAPSATYFRSLKSMGKKEREACKQKVDFLDELIVQKLSEYVSLPKVNLPDNIPAQDEYSIDDCEQIASLVRNYWGLGDTPIDFLIDTLQDNGFIISHVVLNNKKVDAFSRWINGRPYILVSSDKESSVRFRFSVAHELGHLLLHNCSDEIDSITHDRIEDEANAFASAFLLPQRTFFKDIVVPSLEHLLRLKKKWKVSVGAMIVKCGQFGVFGQPQVESLYRALSYNGWRRTEPNDDICSYEKPYMLKQAIELLVKNEIISMTNIESEFCLQKNEIANWCEVPASFFSPKEAPQRTSVALRTV